jgi:hypothetical protein
MRRLAPLLALSALLVAGCALPKLPSLPSIGDLKDAITPPVEGDTAREAVGIAAPVAKEWAADGVLVGVRGSQIDTGGRDHGLDKGSWLVQYQSATKQKTYNVRVTYQKPAVGAETPFEEGQTPLDAGLGGLLDSPEAITKAGLGAKSYSVILTSAAQGPRYQVLADGAGTSATVDARSGAKL